MTGIIAGIKAVKEVADIFDKHGMSKDAYEQIRNSPYLNLAATKGSLTKLLGKYVVSPVIIATEGAKEIEIFEKMNELSCDVFSSFYLQAFKILHTYYHFDVTNTIDILSTSNSPYASIGIKTLDKIISKEEDQSYRQLISSSPYLTTTVSIEDEKDKNKTDEYIGRDKSLDDSEKDPLHSILQRTLNITTKIKNKDGVEHTIMIPIIIKAHVIITSINSILNMLTPTTRDKGFLARWDEYRAGSINFAELLFCNDLIKQYKTVKMKDKDKLLDLINSRTASSMGTGIKTGVEGYEANYNMVIITSEDKLRIDKYIGGDIKKENFKQRFLEQTHALAVSIMDQDYERVSMLISDIRGDSDFSFKAIAKRKSKDSNNDLSDMIKSMMLNKPIGF